MQERAAGEALAPLDPSIDPSAPIRTLKVAQRQIVEIARAMMEDAKVLAMDEPTSSLTPAEFERLAVLIAELAAKGVSIIYVSHKMDEVFRVCDTATILRDGRKVDDVVMNETTESAVIARMVGRELAAAEHKGFATSEVVLEVSGLTRGTAVRDACFIFARARSLAFPVWSAPGRTELLRLMAGVDRRDGGEIRLEGERLPLADPRTAIASGLRASAGRAQARRHRRPTLDPLNIALSSMHRFSRFGFVRQRALGR